jgi:hypothetical protein
MSTAVWPPIDAAQLAREQTVSQQRELDWLLVQLKETLQSLKAGLEECAALLAPSENGSTLVLTSVRSESLKGLVTRVGTRIVKGVRSTPRRDMCRMQELMTVEYQAPHPKPASTARLPVLRHRHLVCPDRAHARRPPAHGGAHLDQQLPRCHRRRLVGRRCDQRQLRRRPITITTRPHPRGPPGAEGLFGRAAAVVGAPRRRAHL